MLIYSRVSPRVSPFNVGNYSHSCKFAETFFIHGTGGKGDVARAGLEGLYLNEVGQVVAEDAGHALLLDLTERSDKVTRCSAPSVRI